MKRRVQLRTYFLLLFEKFSQQMSEDKQVAQSASTIELKSMAERVEYSFSSLEVPKLYANGFISGHSRSDVYVVLERNGQPIAVLNMSFTTAKSLQESLAKTISNLEVMTDHVIMTIDDISTK